MASVRVGTCSWADKTMIRAWYPPEARSAESRLRHYASRFDTVEVDATFYGLPSSDNSRLWVARTPPSFTFHVKAYGLMTGHSVPESRLPQSLKGYDYRVSRYGNVRDPAPNMLRETFQLFREGIDPLRQAGKLGVILLQFPPYFTAKTPKAMQRNMSYIRACRNHLDGYEVVVEFRHRSWLAPGIRDEVLGFLEALELGYVSVDAPRLDDDTVVPPVAAATSQIGYVRFHGRNGETWNAKVSSAAERFKYLYSREDLSEWIDRVRHLEERTDRVYAMFNNCYGDYAPRNALMFREMLQE